MITIRLEELVNAIPVLTNLGTQDFSGRIAFSILKLLKKLEEEYQLFEKTREKIVLKYAKKDDAGQPLVVDGRISILEDSIKTCNKEITDLLQNIVQIDSNKIKAEWLDEVRLSPQSIIEIEPFIEE